MVLYIDKLSDKSKILLEVLELFLQVNACCKNDISNEEKLLLQMIEFIIHKIVKE